MEQSKLTEKPYLPSPEDRAYGAAIKTPHPSVRPMMMVYHEGVLRYVYTDTWTLKPPEQYGRVYAYWRKKDRGTAKAFVAQHIKRSSLHGPCERCGEVHVLTRHHVVHRSRGGGGGSNLQLLCWPCHAFAHSKHGVPSGVRVPAMAR